jgi:hypothetical protein
MWKTGYHEGYKYAMKHFDEPSQFGIGGWGRISKLEISKDGKWLFNYDRGDDINELDEGGLELYEYLIDTYN